MRRLTLALNVCFLSANLFAVGARKGCVQALHLTFYNPFLVERAARIDNLRLSTHQRHAHIGAHFSVQWKLWKGETLERAELERLLDLMQGHPLSGRPYLKPYDVVLEYLSIFARHQPEKYHVGYLIFNHYQRVLGSDQIETIDFYQRHLMRLWIPILELDPNADGNKHYRSEVVKIIEKARPALDFLLPEVGLATP